MTYSNRSYVEVEKTILISFDYYYQKNHSNAYVITNCTCENKKVDPPIQIKQNTYGASKRVPSQQRVYYVLVCTKSSSSSSSSRVSKGRIAFFYFSASMPPQFYL